MATITYTDKFEQDAANDPFYSTANSSPHWRLINAVLQAGIRYFFGGGSSEYKATSGYGEAARVFGTIKVNDIIQNKDEDINYRASFITGIQLLNRQRDPLLTITGFRVDAGEWKAAMKTGTLGGDTLLGKADKIRGASKAEQLHGFGGNDTIWGRGGDDVLDGGEGDDLLMGEQGSDVLTGGEGKDRFRFTHMDGSTDIIIDFASGIDKIEITKSAFKIGTKTLTDIKIGVGTTDTFTNTQNNFHYNSDSGELFFAGVVEPIAYFADLPERLAATDFRLV